MKEAPDLASAMDANPAVLNDIERDQKVGRVLKRAGISRELARKSGIIGGIRQTLDQISEPEAVSPDKTCSGVISRFLTLRLAEVDSKKRSLTGYDNIRRWLGELSKFFGGDFDFSTMSDELWEKFYLHVSGRMSSSSKPWSDSYARDVLSTNSGFVEWAAKQKLCVRPATLKDYRIIVADPEVVETYTIDEVQKCLAAATGQTKLHLLLMLNLGHTQQDISDLEKSQVDLVAGIITRKRSKTRGKKTVPVVCYKLWPETLAELTIHMAKCDDPKFALCTAKGKRWVRTRLVGPEKRLSKADGIDSNFSHVQSKTGIKKGLSVFRATSSDLIAQSQKYRDMKSLFLGHSNKLLADRRYANAPNSSLSKAIEWLRSQYGFK